MFAYRIDKKPMKYKDEIDFLENQYILCQPYFIKHKDETEGEKRNERISFFETPNCKVKGHQTERKHEY